MPRYYNLPENDERRRLQRELRENTDKTVPGYQAYAEAMEELDKLMDAYSEMDKWGVPRQIDEAGKKELTEAMTKAALAGEKLLENAGAPDKKGDPAVQSTAETVKKIQAMMSRDMNLLQQYDPNGAEKKSLPELQQDARTVTVDLSGKEMDKMRGAQSDRIPMTLKDAKGNPRKGFFTKASKFSVKPDFEEALASAKRGASRNGVFFDDFLSKYRFARTKKDPKVKNYSDEFLIAQLIQKNGRKGSAALMEHLADTFGISKAELLSRAGYRGIENFSSCLKRIAEKTPASYLNLMLDMREGERVDQRNSAMSAVADLLGKPGLIARSTNMKFKDSEGNIIEGTFMDSAKGTDLQGGTTEKAKLVGDKPFDGPGKEGLRQLCDLQVLDYICGNIDRHSGNVLYEFDENGKIIGIQGIDNDSSFSRFSPRNIDLNNLMTAPSHMRVISGSMAKKIKETDPAMLKFTLRGRGLSEEEMDAAVKRLNITKEAIKEGEEYYKTNKKPSKDHLYVLPDDQFSKLDISYMRRRGNVTSTINEVDIVTHVARKRVQDVEAGKEVFEVKRPPSSGSTRPPSGSSLRAPSPRRWA
ncbi:MAG: hypothetical protein IJM11_04290 [Firmicutes bacterium]|nr:hypothetical protein [Bacillota bacterium]